MNLLNGYSKYSLGFTTGGAAVSIRLCSFHVYHSKHKEISYFAGRRSFLGRLHKSPKEEALKTLEPGNIEDFVQSELEGSQEKLLLLSTELSSRTKGAEKTADWLIQN